MGCRRGLLALALAVGLLEAAQQVQQPPEGHFLIQATAECTFTSNGTGPREEGGPSGVRFIKRYLYDRQEFVRFDSDWGEYRAISLLGEPTASYWNSQKEALEYKRSQVENFCRHNYGIDAPIAFSRRVRPKLKITPTEDEAYPRETLLICTVAGFWPSEIEVKWFRNGGQEKWPEVIRMDLTRNGDWTFQIKVMLVTKPERGDVYVCQVEHASFASPARVQWEPQTDSGRSKMWTGVAGIILGLVFLVPGLLLYLKNRKGNVLPQSPVALMS